MTLIDFELREDPTKPIFFSQALRMFDELAVGTLDPETSKLVFKKLYVITANVEDLKYILPVAKRLLVKMMPTNTADFAIAVYVFYTQEKHRVKKGMREVINPLTGDDVEAESLVELMEDFKVQYSLSLPA